MATFTPVPIVRCRLEGPEEDGLAVLRYVPLAEFELWRHLMETRHARGVVVEATSVWICEQAAWWSSRCAPEDLVPVLRVCFEHAGPEGSMVPVERFFPAETFPQAEAALYAHFQGASALRRLSVVPGYFIPAGAQRAALSRPA